MAQSIDLVTKFMAILDDIYKKAEELVDSGKNADEMSDN